MPGNKSDHRSNPRKQTRTVTAAHTKYKNKYTLYHLIIYKGLDTLYFKLLFLSYYTYPLLISNNSHLKLNFQILDPKKLIFVKIVGKC